MSATHHMLAFMFLTPWLMAAGAAATSIPIVIHLLNKRKFRVVVWAAMDWLLAAQRRNARRLRFHRWLLLAVRCLALLFLAAGVAELLLQNSALAGLLGKKRATIIIWDDSYSMGYQQNAADAGGASTAFEKSRRLIRDYVQGLPQGQSVMVIRASRGAAAATANVRPVPDHQLVLDQQVAHVQLSDSATDLPAAFDRAAQVFHDLSVDTAERELLVLTDFTMSSIHDPRRGDTDPAIEGAAGNRLKNAVAAATKEATQFHVVNVGASHQENLAVTGLQTLRPIVVAGHQADLQVEVFNASDKTMTDVPVSLLIDGVPGPVAKIARIEPATFQTAQLSIQVATPGRHLVEAQLPDDALIADNTRRLMLNFRKDISVLLVDGSPGNGRTSFGSTFYLRAALLLSGSDKPSDVFAVTSINEINLPSTPLANHDVVVLSDVLTADPVARQALTNYVASGGLLMVFPGSHASAQLVNDYLGALDDPRNDHWIYTTQAPTGNWTTADFNDDKWTPGRGPYGADNAATPWSTREIWVRREFDRTENTRGAFTINLRGLEAAQVYVNGTQVPDATAGDLVTGKRYALPENVLRPGHSVIAVHGRASEVANRLSPLVDIRFVSLLPARLGEPVMGNGGDANAFRLFDPEGFNRNPVMRTFAADETAGREVGLLTVQTSQYFKLNLPADKSTETILRYAGKQGTAADEEDAAVVLRRRIGADPEHGVPGGNVVLFASSADMTWNTWGGKASFVPFMHELIYYSLGRGSLNAGGGLTLDAGDSMNLPASLAPSGQWKGPRATQVAVTADASGLHSVPLWFAGSYMPVGEDHAIVAVNADAREADVRSVPKDQMAAALGAKVEDIVENPQAMKWNVAAAPAGNSFGPLLLLLALCLFVLESGLALAFSVYR